MGQGSSALAVARFQMKKNAASPVPQVINPSGDKQED